MEIVGESLAQACFAPCFDFGVVGGSWPQVTWLGRGGAAAAAGAMMVAGSVHVRRRATAVAEARREMTQPLSTAV